MKPNFSRPNSSVGLKTNRTNSLRASSTSPTEDSRALHDKAAVSRSANQLNGTIFVILPVYNEAAGLPKLLDKIQAVFHNDGRSYHVIVVDDASTDNSAEIASQASFHLPLTLIQHKVNQNLPGALRSGFEEAMQRAGDQDIIITMDGDDTQPPASMDPMIQRINEGYDVVIASRFQNGSSVVGVPVFRQLTAFGARILFKTVLPIKGVRDYTCGYRAYRTTALRMAMQHYGSEFISEAGFSCMADVLLKMRRFNFQMGEVPMHLRYDQKVGASKMSVSRNIFHSLQLLLKRRFGN